MANPRPDQVGAQAPVEIVVLNQPTGDLAYEASTERIYASVPGSGTPTADTITPIDPLTGSLEPSVFVGDEPGQLALSDTGTALYVAFDGGRSVRRFDVPTRTAGLQFTLGTIPFFGDYKVRDLEVQPGSPGTVAISRVDSGQNGRGAVVYQDGVQLANVVSVSDVGQIAFGDSPERLYGSYQSTLTRMSVSVTGLSVVDQDDNLGLQSDIEFQAGRLSGTQVVLSIRKH
jgi:DNA-binding beta-propeller fold protein YncE